MGCRQPSLLVGLDQRQANEVVSLLQRNNIAASKVDEGKVGHSVRIDQNDFSAAVDLLELYALPSRSRIEIAEMFPADSLVASPRAEKARLYSALEQRLEQSLATLGGIVTARVHVSYDLESGESGRKVLPITLSALVVHERDIEPNLLIADIKRFLKNTFSAMEYENISVVLSKRSPIQHVAPSREPLPQSFSWLYAILAVVALIFGGFAMFLHRQSKSREVRDAIHQ
ncbi:type III secretion protein J [Pseudomonas sp. LAMO17WK12:I10]|nr:type III secretion protein J [Pseudomonas sp. LAMO17WK12:I9]SNY51936.1 type III secretion protein J [Pseudomonas sp. LAMO17WK12:I10]